MTKSNSSTIWVGIVPDIFGYGMSVAADSKAECEKALRARYTQWKRDTGKLLRSVKQPYDASETAFASSFENFGGRIMEIKKGEVYFDHFAK